jgi:hypothetical protein
MLLLLWPVSDYGYLRLINPLDPRVAFRGTLFTQSLYLVPVAITFFLVRAYYSPSWDRYLFAGALFLACYGLYEVTAFQITGTNPDFLSNRVFEERVFEVEEGIVSSVFAVTSFAGVSLMKLKSLTGEPSMYAYTILPYWIYATYTARYKTSLLLFASLLLTVASTAFLGIALVAVAGLVFGRQSKIAALLLIVTAVAGWYFWDDFLEAVVEDTFLSKVRGENYSGLDRWESFTDGIEFWMNADWSTRLLGLGFGHARSPDLFSTLLVNVGAIGLAGYVALFLYPFFRLPADRRSTGLKVALLVVLLTGLVACSEYAYLSSWVFLGMAFNRLDSLKRDAGARDRVDDGSRLTAFGAANAR